MRGTRSSPRVRTSSTRTCSQRLAQRLSYHHGDFEDAATYAEVGEGDRGEGGAGLLPRDPAVALRHGGRTGSRRKGSPTNGRVVVEKPFGHDLASARALNEELHASLDESQIYRIDHFLGKMSVEDILFLRFSNTVLEPIWNRYFIDSVMITMGEELRHRRPRPLLRPGRRDARRRPEPPPPGPEPRRDGAAGGRERSTSSATASATSSWRCPTPIRRSTCAASTAATSTSTASRRARRPRRTARCGSRSTTGAGRASRSSSVPASRCR